ncbi:hypothetical protein [Actinoplanes sp. NPDC051851]|uniref:hypothetical protein n=1 Tax=Actinoplanes sp. NPDC051851 TaxID=3154753 RepID=UPI0034212E76
MAETKEEISAERDRLRTENESLRAQLAASNKVTLDFTGTALVPHRFQLSEGDRAELEMRGQVNIGGKLMTRDEVRELLDEDQRDVILGDEA